MTMNYQTDMIASRWIESFEHFLNIKKIYVLSGNINDIVLYKNPSEKTIEQTDISHFLVQAFQKHQFNIVAFYDESDGFCIPEPSHKLFFDNAINGAQVSEKMNVDHCKLLLKQNHPVVLILRFYSEGSKMMLTLLKSALYHLSVFGHPDSMIVCLFDFPQNIPHWLYQNDSNVHSIDIGKPSEKERFQFLTMIVDHFHPPENNLSQNEQDNCLKHFSRLTEGLLLSELNVMPYLSKRNQLSIEKSPQLISQYKFGRQSDIWQRIDSQMFENANQFLNHRIKGQDEVVHAVMDTLKRACIGLYGIPGTNQMNTPRSVLFFAGPTGVGKTEMTRCIADIFFGDQSQLYRLDMNEFSEPSAESLLFGSTTNDQHSTEGCLLRQVKQYPASLIVFENIESAHPNVLDRLPKILNDGYITGPQGNTVFFSETIIIFTTSIGSAQGKIGDKKYDFTETGFMPKYEIVKQLIRMTVEDHFKVKLKRPKLFHCLGDNIFVFDFIRGPVIPDIIEKMVADVISAIAQRKGLKLTCSDRVFEMIHETVLRKDVNGARGIANVIEHVLVNPLSRFIFDNQKDIHEHIYISDIKLLVNQSFEMYEIITQHLDISTDLDLEELDI
jgi:hypothetical protein